jgi:sugar lactone lactonase YvrE
MTDADLTTLVEGGHFFEGPRWRDGRWWASDFYRHQVLSWAEDGSDERVELEVAAQPSGLGWLPDGSLLAVSMLDRKVLRRAADGTVSVHADLDGRVEGPLNDMVVSASGHAYVGGFGFDLMHGGDPKRSSLWRVDPDGGVAEASGDMLFPNGSVITADGSTLVVGETIGARYTAFTIGDDGSLRDRRVWAQLAPTPPLGPIGEMLGTIGVGPDGCALDDDGCIWCADAMGARVVRVAEGGEIRAEVKAPDGFGVYACMLGGADGRTLLLCCAPDFFEEARAAAKEAKLFTTTVDAAHAGLP